MYVNMDIKKHQFNGTSPPAAGQKDKIAGMLLETSYIHPQPYLVQGTGATINQRGWSNERMRYWMVIKTSFIFQKYFLRND